MKRNDMVKDLASELILAWLDVYSTPAALPGFDKAQELVDRILARAEKEGMLPPYCPIGSERDDGAVQCCQWEPEDEIDPKRICNPKGR